LHYLSFRPKSRDFHISIFDNALHFYTGGELVMGRTVISLNLSSRLFLLAPNEFKIRVRAMLIFLRECVSNFVLRSIFGFLLNIYMSEDQ